MLRELYVIGIRDALERAGWDVDWAALNEILSLNEASRLSRASSLSQRVVGGMFYITLIRGFPILG